MIDSSVDNDDYGETIPLNDISQSQIVENITDHSLELTQNKIPNRPLRKFKYYFLFLLILSISGLVSFITLIISSEKYQKQINMINQSCYQQLKHFNRHQFKSNLKWKQNAKTVAGGNGKGDNLNQLYYPRGIYIDHQQQHIYIADRTNHRIVKWKLGENSGQIVAGGNGEGNRIDQLNDPANVIVDKNNESLIICDYGNKRVVRWSLENSNDKQIIIQSISCWGLMMNENGDLFVSDEWNSAVKRWKKGEKEEEGTVVAGGNGKGNELNQLNGPGFIFIDREETVYVSDYYNHRVMKWFKGAKEGIVVAGGHGQGNSLNQLYYPQGLIVNEVGDIYVADYWNNRTICWPFGSKEGYIIVGGNGGGNESNQFRGPVGLLFDIENNLYVADQSNNRIQQFEIDKT